MLNTADPTIVPTPRSPSVMNVPTIFMNNSGLEVAAAINVAPATSSVIPSSRIKLIASVINEVDSMNEYSAGVILSSD